MHVSILAILGMVAFALSFLMYTIVRSIGNRYAYDESKWYDFSGFPLFFGTLIVWFILFASSEVKYDIKEFKTVNIGNRDGFFTDRGFVNANKQFGKRIEPETIIEIKREIPRFGLVWSEYTQYNIKEVEEVK